MYEGSGLALWLRGGIYSTGKDRNIDPGSVPFGEIAKFKADFFGKKVTLKAAVQRGQAKKRRAKQRILWPIVMLCGCESVNDAKHDHIDGSLNLASCHFVLWSWYLAVIEALQADETWTKNVFTFCVCYHGCANIAHCFPEFGVIKVSFNFFLAALTAFAQGQRMARHALGGSLYSYYPAPFLFSDMDWALTLNRASEKLKTLSNNSLSDTFIKFCSLAKTLKVEKEPDGRDSQLRFNNSLYNAAMHKACMAVLSVMSEPGSTKVSAFEAAIHARTMASASGPVDQLAGWLVDMFHLALNSRLVTCARATDI